MKQPRVAIIGGGMSGICLGALLLREGYDDFVVFEKGDRLGGTWRDNTYPGIACDVPSRFYQFSFAPNPDWTHRYSPGEEIWDYFERVARETGVSTRVRLGTAVLEARWQDGTWVVTTSDGDRGEFDFVVSATGILHHPRYPDIEGLDTFAGPAFHSARWDHAVDLRDKRVGLIGTGSTGVQILGALAGEVDGLVMFQRTPHWVIQISNPEFSAITKRLHRRFPRYGRLSYVTNKKMIEALSPALLHPGRARRFIARMARKQLEKVADPELRRKLTPASEPLCRRMIINPHYFDAVQRPDVEVVTEPIARVEPDGVLTADGQKHRVDALVLATGFDAHAYLRPVRLIGPGGLTLDEAWADGPRAYRTVAVPGFPNFFMLMGPNSPVGNYALTAIAETQSGYVLQWLRRWSRAEFRATAPRQDATDRYYVEVDAALPDTVWATGCDSWYLGQNGKPELFPWAPEEHGRMLAAIRDEEFDTVR